MSKPSLLLVDKDPKSRRVLEVSLRKAGYEVQLAANNVDAWEFLSQKPFDVVISDLTQESNEAISLLSRSREASANDPIPFIFLTREGQVEEKKRALESGAAELIDRPIYAKEFLTRIKLLLQRQNRSRMEGASEHGAFSGALSDLGVVDLLQTLERGHKTGVITIESDARRGELYVRNGRVIDASLGRLQGEDAVYRMFLWTEGVYNGEFKNVRHEERIKLSSQGLVLEGMRRLEEWTRLLDGLPPVQHICEVDYPALAERLGELPDEVNAVLRLFDGHRSLLQVIDDAEFGPIETLTILGKLYAEGILYDTVQKPTRVKGTIPSLELERWLAGLPPILEAAKEPTGALPSASEVSARAAGALGSPEIHQEPGLAVKAKQSVAEEPIANPPAPGTLPNIEKPATPIMPLVNDLPRLSSLEASGSSPATEKQPEAPKVVAPLEPIKVEPLVKVEATKVDLIKLDKKVEASNNEPEIKEEKKAPPPETLPEEKKAPPKSLPEERKAPPRSLPEEKKAPPKPIEDEHDDAPKPRPLSAPPPETPHEDHEDDDILPPSSASNRTLYYAIAATLAVVVLFFAFSGGPKNNAKKPALPAKTEPVEPVEPDNTPVTVPVASTSMAASTSAPVSTSVPVPALPVFPVVLTPEQQKQYNEIVDTANTQYTEAKFDVAIEGYRKAIAIDPYGQKALLGLGNSLYDKGYYAFSGEKGPKNVEDAIKFLEESIQTLELVAQKYPTDALIQFTLATVYEYRSKESTKELTKTLTEDRKRAKALYETYLKLEPNGPYAADANKGFAELKKLVP